MSFRPRLVLAYADSALSALSSRFFRRLGWEVHLTSSGVEARRLAHALRPQVVVVETELRGESGWLTCAKLTLIGADFKVVLVGDGVTREQEEFAEMVGAAAIVDRRDGLPALVAEVHDTLMPTALS
jgi:DNA-binding response OmpR family regulator